MRVPWRAFAIAACLASASACAILVGLKAEHLSAPADGGSDEGIGASGVLGGADYREGFGKNATGGAGMPLCVVTSGSETGPGSFDSCFPSIHAASIQIQFAVDTVKFAGNHYLGSNVTIDGCAQGQSGVVIDAAADDTRGLVIEGPASNVVLRCLNFQNTKYAAGVSFNLLLVDGTGGDVSDVLIDRCTFYQATGEALDLTGFVHDATVQRSLFYGQGTTMLVKYNTRQNISVHHNVFTRNGERNPQVKGDMRLFDFVNNVIHKNDMVMNADGTRTDPYGTRIHSCGPGCDSPGEVVGNFVNNAYVGQAANIQLVTGPDGGANTGAYIGGNYCVPSTNCPVSPRVAPNEVPAPFAVTTLPLDALKSQLLPVVGAPNRTPLDSARIDDVAAALP